jgi:heme exporter protein C
MLVIFLGYLAVRSFLEDPEARARISALVATVGFFTLPIVYKSVEWWRTLHQRQSSPSTVDSEMVVVLRVMFVAFALLAAFLISRRYLVARLEGEREQLELQPEG